MYLTLHFTTKKELISFLKRRLKYHGDYDILYDRISDFYSLFNEIEVGDNLVEFEECISLLSFSVNR